MTKPFYEVLVGNIGKVYEGHNKMEAEIHFDHYKTLSGKHIGRASGEDVSLWQDNEPILEHIGEKTESN